MQSRKNQMTKYTFVGGTTGLLLGGTVGCLVRAGAIRACTSLPGYFDKTLEKSAEHLSQKITDVASTQANHFREKLHHMTNGVGGTVLNEPRKKAITQTINYVATNIPSSLSKHFSLGSLASKTLGFSNPILKGISPTVVGITTDVIKTGLVKAGMETVNQYRIFPMFCLLGTLAGAGTGAYMGYTRKEKAEVVEKSNQVEMTSLLPFQSLFKSPKKEVTNDKPSLDTKGPQVGMR